MSVQEAEEHPCLFAGLEKIIRKKRGKICVEVVVVVREFYFPPFLYYFFSPNCLVKVNILNFVSWGPQTVFGNVINC